MGFKELDEVKKWNKIGVQVSGGADSAITLYKIAKSLPEKSIIPISYSDPNAAYNIPLMNAPAVVEYCKVKFKNISDHIIIPITYEHWREKSKIMRSLNIELGAKGVIDFLVSGRTAIPPGMSSENRPERVNDFNVWQDEDLYGKRLYKPFTGIDKKQIWKFYQEEGVEDLWDLTGSCVRTYPACGECWWCKEREYARG